jgi:hypothetical protein
MLFDNLHTGGGKVVSPTHKPRALLPRNIIFLLLVVMGLVRQKESLTYFRVQAT